MAAPNAGGVDGRAEPGGDDGCAEGGKAEDSVRIQEITEDAVARAAERFRARGEA